MRRNSILIIVGHGLYFPWTEILYEGQRKTWLTWALPEHIKVVHFHGTPVGKIGLFLDKQHELLRWNNRWTALFQRSIDRSLALPFKSYIPRVTDSSLLDIEQKALHVHIPDIYFTQSWQNFAWFKYFIEETAFDFVFTTTTSSLIRPHALSEIVSTFDSKLPIYAGVKPYVGANFAAGNNRLLSRAAASLILSNRHKLDFGEIEDVGIGSLLSRLGVTIAEIPSLHISSLAEFEEKKNLIASHFHIRVKSGPLQQRNDIQIMQEVFRYINKEGLN